MREVKNLKDKDIQDKVDDNHKSEAQKVIQKSSIEIIYFGLHFIVILSTAPLSSRGSIFEIL